MPQKKQLEKKETGAGGGPETNEGSGGASKTGRIILLSGRNIDLLLPKPCREG